jgi:predicted metal-dependent phosphoesterase TrpH
MSHGMNSKRRWLKAELHAHCNLDPSDHRLCTYSAAELIEEAARLQYEVLAITCHNLDVWTRNLAEYAASLGITLLPGMEVSVDGCRHVLAYNFATGAENLRTFSQIRRLARPDTLVVAPHPYFPTRSCLGRRVEENVDLFDAVEVSGFYAKGLDFNRRARRIAAAHRKPLVGNADVHQLWQLGKTFTWIEADPEVESILHAVKEGRVRVESTALSYAQVVRWWATAIGRFAFSPFFARSRNETKPAAPSTTKVHRSEIAG